MTPEERLRSALAELDVPVDGDGLDRIRERLTGRSGVHRPAAWVALLTVATVAGLGVHALTQAHPGGSPGGTAAAPAGTVAPRPAASVAAPSTTPGGCGTGLCVSAAPVPPPKSGVTSSGSGTPIWPFSTDEQAASWREHHGNYPWARDPVLVARHLLLDYLKLPGRLVVRRAAPARAGVVQVVVTAAGRPISVLSVERVGPAADGPWSVTGGTAEDVAVTSPQPGDAVSAPLTVTGRVTGYDESVHLQMRTDEGVLLSNAYAPAGADQPWSARLNWDNDWTRAALSAVTLDGKGDLHALVVTPVTNDAGSRDLPAPGTTLVGIRAGHVVLADAFTGRTLRQVSYPPVGHVDSQPGMGGSDEVVWVRSPTVGCGDVVVRTSLQHSSAAIELPATGVRHRLPSVSAAGVSLAWIEDPCRADGSTLKIRRPTGPRSMSLPATAHVTSLSVRDDGAVLVDLDGHAYQVPATATSWSQASPLRAGQGCVVRAPAWDGLRALGWERCRDGQHLLAYSEAGRPGQFLGGVPPEPVVDRTSIRFGFVLVDLGSAGAARFHDGRLSRIPDSGDLLSGTW